MAGTHSPLMQSQAVMALFLPVASRLSSRTGLPLVAAPAADGVRDHLGTNLTMVGNSPLILLNDLIVSAEPQPAVGRGDAAAVEDVRAAAGRPGAAGDGLGVLPLLRRQAARNDARTSPASRPAAPQSYFAETYGIEGEVYELTVTADSPLVGMSLGEAEALRGAPLMLALKNGNEARLAPPADTMIWVGSVLGVMGKREQVDGFRANNFLRVSTRLREFGDLFDPSRAGISEAVVPPNSRFIGKTVGELQLRKRTASACSRSTATKTCFSENVRKTRRCAPGDMLVLHSFWTRSRAGRGEPRTSSSSPTIRRANSARSKFWLAMAIFAVTMPAWRCSRIPVSVAMMTGVVGMLLSRRAAHRRGLRAISWRTVFLMACLIPLGWAMDSTGAAAWIAAGRAAPSGHCRSGCCEAAVAILTPLFSPMIGNVGATIVMVPMAINLALAVGGNPTAFALIVALSGSNNVMTVSNPVISMITGPGGYNAKNLWRIGSPLVLVYLTVMLVAVNLLFSRISTPRAKHTSPSRTSSATARRRSPRHGPATHAPSRNSKRRAVHRAHEQAVAALRGIGPATNPGGGRRAGRC